MSEPKRVVVEEKVPLSRSILWELQRRFYLGRGPRAWADGDVPSWITSNPLLGGFYAEIVVTWALEGLGAEPTTVKTDEPITIVEIGAGSGMLAFRFLTRLTELAEIWKPAGLSFRYVLTDLAQANVDFWKQHEQFSPFFESGLLTLARYDPLADGAAVYPDGERPIVAGSSLNPMVVLANYFFDSIPTDLVKVEDGRAWVARLSTTAPHKLDARPDPAVIGDLEHTWTWHDYELEPYGDPTVDELARFYTDNLASAHFPFPVAGFEVMQALDELSAGRLLILTADKGANHLSRFGGTEHKQIVRHGNGFSFDANPDAIGRWIVAKGGFVMHNAPGSPLSITAGFLGATPRETTATRLAWRRTIDARDPSEFYPHLKVFIDQKDPVPASLFTTLLRESAWDPYVVSTLQKKVAGKARKLSSKRRQKLLESLRRAWRNYFPIGEKQDVPFLFGTLAFELQAWDDARLWFEASIAQHGRGAAVLHNIGLTLAKEDRWDKALPWFRAAIEEQPGYKPAAKFLALAEKVVAAEAAQRADEATVPETADDATPGGSAAEE